MPATDQPKEKWYRRLSRHPIFPLILFVIIVRIIGEFYPLSPYSMYSNPTTRPLRYCYIADGDGKPIPIQVHTRETPARIGKMVGTKTGKLEDMEKKRARNEEGYKERPRSELRKLAGKEVLEYLRRKSFQQKKEKRHLKQPIQLIEIAVGFKDGKFDPQKYVTAELGPHEE